MKTVIAGGRDYSLSESDVAFLDGIDISEVVSGGANGADRDGEMYAAQRGLSVKVFQADWQTHGRAAGPLRNKQMAKYADAVVLFPGGRGTASMKKEATLAGIKIYEPHQI